MKYFSVSTKYIILSSILVMCLILPLDKSLQAQQTTTNNGGTLTSVTTPTTNNSGNQGNNTPVAPGDENATREGTATGSNTSKPNETNWLVSYIISGISQMFGKIFLLFAQIYYIIASLFTYIGGMILNISLAFAVSNIGGLLPMEEIGSIW